MGYLLSNTYSPDTESSLARRTARYLLSLLMKVRKCALSFERLEEESEEATEAPLPAAPRAFVLGEMICARVTIGDVRCSNDDDNC